MLISRIALTALLSIGFSSSFLDPAFAARQSFSFDAVVDENSFGSIGGPPLPDLYGEIASFTISYEDSGLVNGDGEVSPPALTVDMMFLGKSFTERDDDDYPSFPILEVENDEPVVMDLVLVELDFGDPRILEIQAGFSGRDFMGDPRGFIDIVSVPEPSAAHLALVSLSTVAAVRRWRRI